MWKEGVTAMWSFKLNTRLHRSIAATSVYCFILQLVSNLKEENTLLKQEKEALNHLIVEQAKEMTGKTHMSST